MAKRKRSRVTSLTKAARPAKRETVAGPGTRDQSPSRHGNRDNSSPERNSTIDDDDQAGNSTEEELPSTERTESDGEGESQPGDDSVPISALSRTRSGRRQPTLPPSLPSTARTTRRSRSSQSQEHQALALTVANDNGTRYDMTLGPDRKLVPYAYGPDAIRDETRKLAVSLGIPDADRVQHPFEILDHVMGATEDSAIARDITVMADTIERQFQRCEVLSEFFHAGLRDNTRFQKIVQENPHLRQALQPVEIRVTQAKKARERMGANIDRMRAYMGAAYFDRHFLNAMTPSLADILLTAVKHAYGNEISFTDMHRNFDRARRDRLGLKGKGLRTDPELKPSDIVDALKGDFNPADITDADIELINGATKPESGAARPIRLGSEGFLQPVSAGSVEHPVTLDGPQVLYDRSGNPSARARFKDLTATRIAAISTTSKLKKRRRAHVPQTMTYRPPIEASRPHRAPQPRTQGQARPDSSEADVDLHSPLDHIETVTGGAPAIDTEQDIESMSDRTDTASTEMPSSTTRTTLSPLPEGTDGLGQSSQGRLLMDIEGIRPLSQRWDEILSDIGPTATTTRPNIPRTWLGTDLASRLLTVPSDTERDLLKYVTEGVYSFGGARTASEIPPTLKTIPHGEILQATCRLIAATKAGWREHHADKHPVTAHSHWPWMELLAMIIMDRTLELVDARRDPDWITHARWVRNDMLRHHEGASDTAATIAVNVHQETIALVPDAITEDQFFLDDDSHPGRYNGHINGALLSTAIEFLTRHDRQAQVVSYAVYAAWRSSTSTPPSNEVASTNPIQHDLSSRQIVYMPMRVDAEHWSLLILDHAARRYEVLDSMPTPERESATLAIVQAVLRSLDSDTTTWCRGSLSATRQIETADSGFWVTANAAAYTRHKQAAGQSTTANLRTWLLRVLCTALVNAAPSHTIRSDHQGQWVNEAQGDYLLQEVDRKDVNVGVSHVRGTNPVPLPTSKEAAEIDLEIDEEYEPQPTPTRHMLNRLENIFWNNKTH